MLLGKGLVIDRVLDGSHQGDCLPLYVHEQGSHPTLFLGWIKCSSSRMFTQAISGIRSTCKLTLGLFSIFGVLDIGRRFCGSQLDFVAELVCGLIREVGRSQAVRAFRLKQQLSKAQSVGSERRGNRSFIAGDSSYGLPLGYLLRLLACSCFILYSLVTGSLMLNTMTCCRQQLPSCLACQCMCKCIPPPSLCHAQGIWTELLFWGIL